MASKSYPGSVHQQLRPRKTRTKSNCLECRSRRKKCDETRPTCRNCARWQTCCTWPGFRILGAAPMKIAQDVQTAGKVKSPPPVIRHNRRRRSSNGSIKSLVGDDQSNDECISIPMEVAIIDSSSSHLLEFFVLEGSKGLSAWKPSDDPFVRLALQLSQTDELIKSGVLAISASRMSAMCALDTVQQAALHHYNETLAQLHSALASWPPTTGEEMIRVLTASILLCHHDAMLGNGRDSLQSHLRACREMVKTAQNNQSSHHYSAIYGVLFEAYAYFSTHTIFRYSASELDVQANLESLQFYRSLTSYSTFGYLMVAARELYTLVPYVARFGLRMRHKEDDDRNREETEAEYYALESQIMSLQNRDLTELPEVSVTVAMIYQNCLLILLHASYMCREAEQSQLQTTLKPIVAETMALFETIKDTPASAPTFWPMVILGSCLSEECDKALMLSYLKYGASTAGIHSRACEALMWIWDRQSQCLFGPSGLERFSRENSTGLCIG